MEQLDDRRRLNAARMCSSIWSNTSNVLRRGAATALSIGLGLAVAAGAQAAVVTAEFEGAAGELIFANYFEDGLRFSPNSHHDGLTGPTGQWLGWDTFAQPNLPPFIIGSNADWLGPAALSPNTNGGVSVPPWMYIDAGGALFSLQSVDVMAYQLEFTSSRGGSFLTSGMEPYPQSLTFVGDEWTNVQWLLVRAISPGLPAGIDNLVVDVAEPGTLALALAALFTCGGLGVRNRRNPVVVLAGVRSIGRT
jgi:hypothetical protein